MQKNILLFLVAASIISLAVATGTATVTCNNHPAFAKAKSLITATIASDAKGKPKSDALQTQYQSAKPTVLTATDLGVCKDYAGQSTCCNANIVKLIDQAALLKVKPIQQAKSAFQKLVNVYIAKLTKTCSANVINTPTPTADAIFANTALTNFQGLRTTQKGCKIAFATAISSYTRAAMCTICAGVDKVSDYFNASGQLKISPDSIAKFTKATDDAITCTAGLFSSDNLDKVLAELNKAYIKGSDACGTTVASAVKTAFTDPKVKNDDGKGGKVCKGTTVFADNSACENILQGDSGLESKRLLRGDDESMLRLLQATPDAVSDPSGVSVYTPSTTDSTIDENGTAISGNFDNIATSTSNSSSLAICAFFALLALLI